MVGDLTPVFGRGNVMFRNVRCREEVATVAPFYAKLATLNTDSPERAEILQKLWRRQVYRGGTMTLDN